MELPIFSCRFVCAMYRLMYQITFALIQRIYVFVRVWIVSAHFKMYHDNVNHEHKDAMVPFMGTGKNVLPLMGRMCCTFTCNTRTLKKSYRYIYTYIYICKYQDRIQTRPWPYRVCTRLKTSNFDFRTVLIPEGEANHDVFMTVSDIRPLPPERNFPETSSH